MSLRAKKPYDWKQQGELANIIDKISVSVDRAIREEERTHERG